MRTKDKFRERREEGEMGMFQGGGLLLSLCWEEQGAAVKHRTTVEVQRVAVRGRLCIPSCVLLFPVSVSFSISPTLPSPLPSL